MQRKKLSSKFQCPSTNLRLAELTRFHRHQFGDEVIDVRHHIFKTYGADLWRYTPAAMGKFIGLRYELRQTLRIRTIQCVDKSPAEVAALVCAQKNQRERERRARKRKTKPLITSSGDLFNHGPLSERTQAVFDLVTSRNWITAAALAVKAKNIGSFRALEPETLRRVVHRVLRALERRGLVQRRPNSARAFQYRRSGRAAAS
jgi:hypothetical protein